ncbi:MAG: hypothetical protein IID61_15320 [SAR324 cluster bacterium]|nr:hypothetical protein [SAR324 cluster bacterium]
MESPNASILQESKLPNKLVWAVVAVSVMPIVLHLLEHLDQRLSLVTGKASITCRSANARALEGTKGTFGDPGLPASINPH